MAGEVILTNVSDRVATLTFNRPDKLNALSPELITQSVEALSRWGRDPEVGAIVVTGAGRAFCAGGDISSMGGQPQVSEARAPLTLEQRVDGLRESQELSWLLYNMPKVTIAAVNGFAMGAGLGVCLACDLRIAAETAKFGTAYAKVGLGGDFGVTWLLTHCAGATKAKELFFLADIIDATEALRLGLVNRVVAPDDLSTQVHEIAARIAHGPLTSFRYMKANVNLATTTDFRTVLDTSATTYGGVRYADLYAGIDLVYYGRRQRLEYDFVVAAGADPDRIVLAFEGAEPPAVDAAGTLVARTAAAMLRQARPVAYQEIDGTRHAIDASFLVDGARRVRFKLAAYDRARPLVIDPLIDDATYLGGTSDEADEPFEGIEGVAVDGAGNFYVTGTTQSPDFPTTVGADRTLDGTKDIFVTKFSPAGAILYSTYLGSGCDDTARDIAVDAAGNAYVTGRFNAGFCYAETAGALVAKLDPAGALVCASVLGGSLADSSMGQAIAVDTAGHAYVTGETASDDFPTTPGVLQEHAGNRLCIEGCTDAFVTKLDPSGSALVYSTYLFGELDDAGSRIAVDRAGNAYVVGTTNSTYFPIVDAFQSSDRGLDDAFVAKLDPDGTRLVYSSYIGGSRAGESPRTGVDEGSSLALDPTGNAYVVGYTQSYDFPTTPGAFQPALGAGISTSSAPRAVTRSS